MQIRRKLRPQRQEDSTYWLNTYSSCDKFKRFTEKCEKANRIFEIKNDPRTGEESIATSRNSSICSDKIRSTLGFVGPTYLLHGGVLFLRNPYDLTLIRQTKTPLTPAEKETLKTQRKLVIDVQSKIFKYDCHKLLKTIQKGFYSDL